MQGDSPTDHTPGSAGGLTLSRLTGPAIADAIHDLARLRVRVFRAWPYLYDGDEAYEATYLQTYVRSRSAAVIVARDGSTIVGASTCLRLTEGNDEVRAPFVAAGLDPDEFFYFGESVLLPAWRGHGVGVRFFAEREAHARAVSDCAYACFCAVERPDDHPLRPADATSLHGFWQARSYTRRPDLACTMMWRDVGQTGETPKRLVFWLRALHGDALP